MNILVTGGAGYIGSHTIVELLDKGHSITVADNLSNSSRYSLNRVERITGKKVKFVKINLCNYLAVDNLFKNNDFEAVFHFAGLKAVGESVNKPLEYYRNNLDSTLALIAAMQKYKVYKLIFSSSATVYGTPEFLPLKEDSRVGVGISNPYGRTKYFIEKILQDLSNANPLLIITILRYFNPVGAHPSGLIGEDPNDIPNNLLPYVSQVAVGKLSKVLVFGNDYDTPDGTGVRDYIHVVDLAKGHVAALDMLSSGCKVYNLGTGQGISVLQIIEAFSKAANKTISYELVNRRPGDIAACYADCTKAYKELGWKTTKSISEACQDAWRWQSMNPNGYS